MSKRVHFYLPSAVPLTNVGFRAGKEGDRVDEWGTGSLNASWAALYRARLKQES